jgi:hypothetical protein
VLSRLGQSVIARRKIKIDLISEKSFIEDMKGDIN